MASQARRKTSAIDRLLTNAGEFDFFQAVRILERYFAAREESVQLEFNSSPSLAFATHDVIEVQREKKESGELVRLLVSFMGLIGQNGVLPEHYTELLLARIDQKDETFAAFLDIFHNRILRLFYEVWEVDKYYVRFEANSSSCHSAHISNSCHPVLDTGSRSTRSVQYSKHGMDSAVEPRNDAERGMDSAVKPRNDVERSQLDQSLQFVRAISGQPPVAADNEILSPDLWLYYSGLLGSQARSSEGLRLIIEDYFQVATAVSNFGGEWVRIQKHERSTLGQALDGHSCLGVDAVVGERVWHVQNKFEIQLGPMSYATFERLLPNGDMLKALRLLVQRFVGVEFDFSVVLLLKAASVPRCVLRKRNSMRLGWNSWLKNRHSFKQPAVVHLSNSESIIGDNYER